MDDCRRRATAAKCLWHRINMPRALSKSAADFLPTNRSLPSLRSAAAHCQGCDLYKRGTQTVFGEGSAHATVMMVGEQPGDREDLAGHPFVGPAGRILDKALEAAGIQRQQVIVCLGATAAQALLGRSFRVTKRRGELIELPGLPTIVATVHPSSILRAITDEDRHREMAAFTADLHVIARRLSSHRKAA